MCNERLRNLTINIWIKFRFKILHASYGARLWRIEENGKRSIRSLWRKHQNSQMKGLILAIDFRLFFIAPLLSDDFLSLVRENKKILFRKGEIEELATLAEIICHSEIESVEKKVIEFIERRVDNGSN